MFTRGFLINTFLFAGVYCIRNVWNVGLSVISLGVIRSKFYYLSLFFLYRWKVNIIDIDVWAISCHHAIFNACWYLFRFRRLRYCGKQHKLLEDFKKLAVSSGTKREFCLEALLACICGRLGCKYISLTMWWQGTDCNNNKSWKIYFRRIHQCFMG